MMPAGCDLRKVCHAQNLTVASQLAKESPHHLGRGAPNAAVHFVKNQCGHRRDLGGDDGNRQTDAGEFTARGNFLQRPRLNPRMSGNQEFTMFRPVCRRLIRNQGRFHSRSLHGQCLHFLRYGVGQALSCVFTTLGEFRRPSVISFERLLFRTLECLHVLRGRKILQFASSILQPLKERFGFATKFS